MIPVRNNNNNFIDDDDDEGTASVIRRGEETLPKIITSVTPEMTLDQTNDEDSCEEKHIMTTEDQNTNILTNGITLTNQTVYQTP